VPEEIGIILVKLKKSERIKESTETCIFPSLDLVRILVFTLKRDEKASESI